MATITQRRTAGSRIPKALQEIHLSSCRGEEVKEAPADNVAFKTFLRTETSQEYEAGRVNKSNLQWPYKAPKKSSKDGDDTAETCSVASTSTLLSESSPQNSPVAPPSHLLVPNKTERNASKMSPQAYLDSLLKSRGYSTSSKKTLESGYYFKPTPLQMKSYNPYLINLARECKKQEFKSILECGISPQPCNQFGESLVHTVCRRCDPETLQIMINAGARLCVADDYGRTPLHDCCWRPRPCFEMVELIAGHHLELFYMADTRGSLPLTYVHADHWEEFNDFLESKKDVWWPAKSADDGEGWTNKDCNNSGSLPDPPNALNLELAAMVAAGRLSPMEAITLNPDVINTDVAMKDRKLTGGKSMDRGASAQHHHHHQEEDDDDDSYSDSDSSYYSNSSDDFSDSSFEDDDDELMSEMALMGCIVKTQKLMRC